MVVLLDVSRSPRDISAFLVYGCSGQQVGPGSYEAKAIAEAAGGALGKEKRPAMGWRKLKVPGPGAYNLRRAASEATIDRPQRNPPQLGASVFLSRKPRCEPGNLKEPLLVPGSSEYLPSSVADNPGPGTYNLVHSWSCGPRPSSSPDHMRVLAESPPSFKPLRDPEQFRYTGRDIGEEGTMSRPGPGDYEHTSHTAMQSALGGKSGRGKAPVADFHTSTAPRKLYPAACARGSDREVEANPGPGAYDPRLAAAEAAAVKKPASTVFLSLSPQLGSCAQPFVTSSCSPALTPGPGSYSPAATIGAPAGAAPGDPPRESTASRAETPEAAQAAQLATTRVGAAVPSRETAVLPFAGLRSTTTREGWWRPLEQPYFDPDFAKNPGPGHYLGCRSLFGVGLDKVRRIPDVLDDKYLGIHRPHVVTMLKELGGSARLAGFGSGEARGCMCPDKSPEAAGPTTYDRSESTGQSIAAGMREPARIGKAGAFGRTKFGDRFAGAQVPSKPEEPAEAEEGRGPQAEEMEEVARSTWKDQRMRLVTGFVCEHPGPPAAAPPPQPDWSRKSSKFRQPRSDHVAFGSSHNRFVPKAVEPCPGPGEYAPSRASHVGGGAKTTADRKLAPPSPTEILQDATTVAGPGRYDIASTLPKKSFNVTSKDAKSPSQTR